MTEPSRARIDAALRLADAAAGLRMAKSGTAYTAAENWFENMLSEYMATLPKLRTRAEVDAEIVAEVRHAAALLYKDGYGKIHQLCAEPTAPEDNK